MNVITILKQVPDLVEELDLNNEGTGLNREWIKYILSEYDDHALEQSLLLKEQYGGTVKAVGLDRGDINESFFTASAKGADELLAVKGDFPDEIDNHVSAKIFQHVLSGLQYDLIMTGVQAIDDRDGSIGPILAGYLNLPYVGVVHGVRLTDDKKSVVVGKEYPGGIISEICISLPAVVGIQAAEKPPRYIPIAKIRQAQKSAKIQEMDVAGMIEKTVLNSGAQSAKVRRMFKPEPTTKAEMLEGSAEEVASKLAALLAEKGIVR
jgi:electron transfer flavoprotein beta subunit